MTKSRNRQFADLADSASIIDGSTASYTTAEESKLAGVAASANNYVHPNHSGEVTSSADGATVIASNVVDEDNLKVSNSPTNGYFLSAQSGNTGGLTWAAVPAGVGGTVGVDFNDNVTARFGTGYDLQIYHNGTDTVIQEQVNNRRFLIAGDEIAIRKGDLSEDMAKFYKDDRVELTTTTLKSLRLHQVVRL